MWSVGRKLFRIDFEQLQSAVGDVLGLVQTIAQMHGSDEDIAVDGKGKVSLRRRLERAADDRTIVVAGDRRRDIQFVSVAIKELYDNSGMGSGSGILQDLEQCEIKGDFSIAEHPGLSGR